MDSVYCNCCAASSPQCMPEHAPGCKNVLTDMCGKQKLEPQHATQLECSVKNCQIFGVHDTEPFPDYPCPAKKIKAKNPNKNSLGSPLGLIASNVNFKSEGKPTDIVQARFATYLKSFARLHLNPETMWTPLLLDELMREGLALYSSSSGEENKFESPPEIYSASEKKVLREFNLAGCKFHVELMKKFKPSSLGSMSIAAGAKGDGAPTDLPLSQLKSALKLFFRSHKYCIVNIGTLSFMVWRSRDSYFVLDVCGRRLTDLYSDRDKGVSVLLCLTTLENVRHLLIGLTALPKVDGCSLREIKLVKVVTPSGSAVQRDYATRSHQYEIINDDYAYLKANLHLTLNKADLMRNRSALPVGVTALVAIKIDHPATWNSKVLDKILCFGVNFCQACWIKCLANEPIHVEEFPSVFHLGQFKVTIDMVSRKYEGHWHCVPGYKHSQLTASIEKAIKAGDHKLLLQINYQMYAIWMKNNFIYLLDPYRHRILGKPGDSDIYEEMEKTASLRMFRSLDVFLNTLNHILLDSNRSSTYYIHTVKVKGLQLRSAPEEEVKLEANGEVKSINEHICFEESEELCQKALGEISDYEDPDLLSDVDELELKTSSSEAEVVEEEEGGGGLEEELEGLESSSSGDEHPKKKGGAKSGGKKKGGGGKGGGSKSKKGGGGKSKKGGGMNDDEEVPDQKDQKDESRKKKSSNRNDFGDLSEDENKTKKRNNFGDLTEDGKKSKKRNIPGDLSEDEQKSKKQNDFGDLSEDEKARRKEKERKEGKESPVKESPVKGSPVKESPVKESPVKESPEEIAKRKKIAEEEARKSKLQKAKGDEAMRKWGQQEEAERKRTEAQKKQEEEEAKRKALEDEKNRLKLEQEEAARQKKLAAEQARAKAKEAKEAKEREELAAKGTASQSTKEEVEVVKQTIEYQKKMEMDRDRDRDREMEKLEPSLMSKEDKQSLIDKDKNLATEPPKQKRKPFHKDGTEADDESEDDFFKNAAKHFCSGPNPNRYPGYFKCPLDMAVVGSENGSYDSLCKLLNAGFRRADRILCMTPWGNFVVFRCMGKTKTDKTHFFLFDGCTCNVNRFRHLDLSIGTAGLLCFTRVHDAIEYMRRIRKTRAKENRRQRLTADEICRQYCR